MQTKTKTRNKRGQFAKRAEKTPLQQALFIFLWFVCLTVSIHYVDQFSTLVRVGWLTMHASSAETSIFTHKARSIEEYKAINDCINLADGKNTLVCGRDNIIATAKMEAYKAQTYQNGETLADNDEKRVQLNFKPQNINFNPETLSDDQKRAYNIIIKQATAYKWTQKDIDHLLRVAWCESHLGAFLKNDKNNRPATSIDRGLFMYNSYWQKSVSDACAYDFACATNETIQRWNKGQRHLWVCSKLTR